MERVQLVQGDILKQDVTVIVNAANTGLEGGGGIDGAIHAAAGPQLLQACREYKKKANTASISVGEAIITPSFQIRERNPSIQSIIHTAGPNCHVAHERKNKEELLQKAYVNSLELAREHNYRSIAFPAISTGIYGYPFEEAQRLVFETVATYLRAHSNAFDKVLLVYYSAEDFKRAETLFSALK